MICLSKNTIKFNSICRLLLYRSIHQNHYEILNLSKNCTDKEIRESFIKLSKELHPDINKSIKSPDTARFTRIMEAYKVLSRPELKLAYDMELNRLDNMNGNTYGMYKKQEYTGDPNSYYGIKGIKKVSNTKIVILCLTIAAIGVGLQIWAIVQSMTFKRNRLDEQSIEASKMHATARADALKYGNTEQIERFKKRMNYQMNENIDKEPKIITK